MTARAIIVNAKRGEGSSSGGWQAKAACCGQANTQTKLQIKLRSLWKTATVTTMVVNEFKCSYCDFSFI